MENSTAVSGNGTHDGCSVLKCPYLISKEMYTVMVFLYILVIVTGVLMNATVCYIYAKGYVKQSACNLTLASLSVSDIGSDIFTLPYLFLDYTYLDVTPYEGKIICGVYQAGFVVCVGVSIMTLAFISTARFFLINFPLKVQWIHSQTAVKVFIIAAWSIVTIGFMPLFISFRHEKLTNICYREWPPHFNGTVYSAMMLLLGFIIPVTIMLITFCCSSRTLMNTPRVIRKESVAFKERRKIMILLGSLICAFVVFWGPYFSFWVLSRVVKIFPSTIAGEYERKKWVRVVILIALCNTVVDPLIYVTTAKEFRKGFLQVFCYGRPRTATQSYTNSTSAGIKMRLFGSIGSRFVTNTSRSPSPETNRKSVVTFNNALEPD